MAKISSFNNYAAEYDSWFEKNRFLYELELKAVNQFIPNKGRGVEVGSGTGRFSIPLGIRIGIEPSISMGQIAAERGLGVIGGVAESLPLRSGSFNYVLFVTVICFLNSIQQAMKESFRILDSGGGLIIGFIDKNSRLGKYYEERAVRKGYYKDSHFYSVRDIEKILIETGFKSFEFVQTIIDDKAGNIVTDKISNGYGEGSFVVVKTSKP